MTTESRRAPRRSGPPIAAVAMVVIALAVVAAVFLIARPAHGGVHPQPRPALTAAHVMEPDAFTGYDRVKETYRMAQEIPQVLDGLYCYCDCSKHSGHYSLLDCFHTEHAAGCDICLTEAQLAYRMTKEGKSLEQIRDAIDALYAKG